MMTRGTQKTDDRTDSRNKTSYDRLNGKAWLTALVLLSANNTPLVSVDLIGEKNPVILEWNISILDNF